MALSDKQSESAVEEPEIGLRNASGLHKPLSRLFGGIGLRLLVGVLAFSSLVTLALTALQLYIEYRRDLDTINTRLDEIGRSYLGSIGQSLWNLDEDQLGIQLAGILRLPDIRSAEVRETTQAFSPIAIAVGEGGSNAVIVRHYPVVHTVSGVERSIGVLRVEATLAGVYRSLLDRTLIILASQGAKTFLVSFFILYFFHRLVTRHLADVAGSLRDFSFTKPQRALRLQRQPPTSPDELDQVVAAFNALFTKLESTYHQLYEAKRQLETDNAALLNAEAALQESEQQFRDYAETASDWFWETGPDHRFTYISEVATDFAIDRNARIGGLRWDTAADTTSDPEKWRQHRAALDRHENFRGFVYTIYGKDGKLHYVTISGKPVFGEDGRFLGYRGTARDVTARSIAEARVRELSTAVEQSPSGIAIADPAGRLTYNNRVFLEITGLAETNRQAGMASVLSDEVWQRLTAAVRHGGVGREEVFATRLSQEPFWALVSVAGIRSAGGEAGHFVVVLQDITREKAEQLEREGLLKRLQQTGKMEAIGRLAGGIAHDFNNLLGAMMGFSQFLVEDLPEGGEPRRHAERIVKICERGRDLVEQLLAFAQARDTARRVLDLTAVLQRCHDLLETSLPSSSELVIDADDGPLPVLCNEGQLHQVMLNLCLNARDALGTDPGKIAIRLTRTRPSRDTVSKIEASGAGQLEEDRDYALMAVSDTGAGMDAATRARIFEPFFTTKELGRGTGLGLAVVHGIVTSFGGAINVVSAPGSGTTFEIYLPMQQASPEAAAERPARQDDVRGHERILVVDDDPDLAQVLSIGLHRYGYEVMSLTDPDRALRVFREAPQRWDLVVSDQVMPGISGLDLIAELKALQPALRAILYTGFDEGITERTAENKGADALLHKPVTPQAIAAQIRRLMAARAQLS